MQVYFSIVILAYAQRRKSKEDATATADDHPYGQTREDMTSIP
jgi:hypothetical protein